MRTSHTLEWNWTPRSHHILGSANAGDFELFLLWLNFSFSWLRRRSTPLVYLPSSESASGTIKQSIMRDTYYYPVYKIELLKPERLSGLLMVTKPKRNLGNRKV